nr:hypothetical protein GCM10020093_113550 [Planobispora longispora]
MSRIAFIGLGIMGSPMAGHLVRAGHEVTGFDLGEDALARLRAAGGASASGVAEAVKGAEVVITMLPADPQVEAVLPEILDNAESGALYIDFSTITPQTSQKVAREGAARGCACWTPRSPAARRARSTRSCPSWSAARRRTSRLRRRSSRPSARPSSWSAPRAPGSTSRPPTSSSWAAPTPSSPRPSC